MKLGKNNLVTFKMSWYFFNFLIENDLMISKSNRLTYWSFPDDSKVNTWLPNSTKKFVTNSLSCFQVKTMGFQVVPGQDGWNGKGGKRVEMVWKLPVGTYSDGNLFVVYDMSRHVLPTAPSPTTTHLIVCIFTFL